MMTNDSGTEVQAMRESYMGIMFVNHDIREVIEVERL